MALDETNPPKGAEPRERPEGVGDVLLGRYRLDVELGRGGQATVFEAMDLELGRSVAVKVSDARVGRDHTDGWRLLLEEARLQAEVEHEGVARLLDALRDGDRRYLVMELVRGPSLKAAIDGLRLRQSDDRPTHADLIEASGGDRSETLNRSWDNVAADTVEKLAAGVEAMHERGLVHRDLKPGNVVLNNVGRPVVVDFGLAGYFGEGAGGGLSGTLGYMAPEQVGGEPGGHDPRTDVYQVGLILYELATLERAYRIDSSDEISEYLDRAGKGSVLPPEEAEPRINTGLAAVISRALAPEPDDRYSSLSDFRADLRRVTAGRPPKEALTPLWYRFRRTLALSARDPKVLGLVAALVLALFAWRVRASLETDVFGLEAWRFRPGEVSLALLGEGSDLLVGDDLGVRVRNSKSSMVYALSLFGGSERSDQELMPVRCVPLVDGVPGTLDATQWGRALEAGESELLCARADDNAREGLLVFIAPSTEPVLERWFSVLEERLATEGFQGGVPFNQAFATLDAMLAPRIIRGSPVDLAPDAQSERYKALTITEQPATESWDSNLALRRIEFLFPVRDVGSH
ncbi:MAG: serine/threonine protein kinase [Gammaproteobacteria bacterium]|jgi:serine/threonine protein kinase